MTFAFSANKRVLVLRDGKFYECVALEMGVNVNIELDDYRLLVVFEDVAGLYKEFVDTPETLDIISFVLIDPTQDASSQIIGIAERSDFDESAPGRVHLLK